MQSQTTWDDFLSLLEEGQIVNLSAVMNRFSRKIKLDANVPIFATSISEFVLFNLWNELLKAETDMMSARWKVCHFDQIIPTAQQVKVQLCGYCFRKPCSSTSR